jgi:hypothetical protein
MAAAAAVARVMMRILWLERSMYASVWGEVGLPHPSFRTRKSRKSDATSPLGRCSGGVFENVASVGLDWRSSPGSEQGSCIERETAAGALRSDRVSYTVS